jgi:hypothetical protein
MQTRLIPSLGLAVALCSAASAAAPPNVGTLGALDAWVHACKMVAPAGPGAYERYAAALIGNPPAAALSALRETPEYRQTFVLMRDVYLTEVARTNLRNDCLTAIGQTAIRDR